MRCQREHAARLPCVKADAARGVALEKREEKSPARRSVIARQPRELFVELRELEVDAGERGRVLHEQRADCGEPGLLVRGRGYLDSCPEASEKTRYKQRSMNAG